ncbi:MAG TPA: ABC transporter ATP-binding protein [Thermoleophilaceae bacterium]
MQGIQVRQLVKRYGDVLALDRVDLEVAPGSVVALLGPNGAGKSSLVRILATTVLPDSGTASVYGHDVVTDAAQVRASLGLILGNQRSWYWRLSGRRNLEFFAALYGLRRRAAAARADELLAEVELGEVADRRVGEYSDGMRARLALARALLREPPTLVLDEPTQNLDPIASANFRDIVLRLAHERGTSVLLTTHNLHEAAALATEVVVLAMGRVVSTKRARTDAADLEATMLSVAGT